MAAVAHERVFFSKKQVRQFNCPDPGDLTGLPPAGNPPHGADSGNFDCAVNNWHKNVCTVCLVNYK